MGITTRRRHKAPEGEQKKGMRAFLKAVIAVGAVILMTGAPSMAMASPGETPKKVFVCKYVGTPGADERLQTGNNPISVSIHSIQNNQWNGVVPGWFSDAHNRSYVLMYDTTGNGGGQLGEPSVSECPPAEEPPATEPNATASVEVVQEATCDVATEVQFALENATWNGEAVPSDGPNSWTREAIANEGSTFRDGSASQWVSYVLDPATGYQSTDAEAPCYEAPPGDPEIVTGTATFQTLSCEVESKNLADADAVPGGIWTFTDKLGSTFTTASGEGYSGGIPEGLAYGPITVSLDDEDSPEAYDVTPWSGTWTTVSPESLECSTPPMTTPNAKAAVEVIAAATCSAPTQVRVTLENATWIGEPTPGEDPSSSVLEALANEGSTFADGSARIFVTYVIEPALGYQSTNPEAPCYGAPPLVVVTGTATFETASCTEGSKNWVATDGVPNGVWTFTDKFGATYKTTIGGTYTGGVPEGLAYGPIVVSLDDGVVPLDHYDVTPWSGTWTTVDPESLDCSTPPVTEPDATAWVEVIEGPTCDTPTEVRFVLENATWNGEAVPGSKPNSWVREAVADEGSTFKDGKTSSLVTYILDPATGYQSTDPEAPCYKAPPVVKPPVVNPPVVEPPVVKPPVVVSPVDNPTPSTPTELASTGVNGQTTLNSSGVAAGLFFAGALLLAMRRRNRAKQK